MKKIFQLANVELKKTFMRPSLYILTALLFMALVVSAFIFSPEKTKSTYKITGESIYAIYNDFESKIDDINSELTDAKNTYDSYIESENTKAKLKNYFITLNNTYFENLYTYAMAYASNNPSMKNNVIDCLVSTKNYTGEIMTYMSNNINNKYLAFYMTQDNYDNLFKYLTKLSENIKKRSDLLEFDKEAIIADCNYIFVNYKNTIQNKIDLINNFQDIDKEQFKNEFDTIIEEYYYKNIDKNTNAITGKLKTKYQDVKDYFYSAQTKIANEEMSKQDAMNELHHKIISYESFVNQCSTIINKEFVLKLIGNKKDSEISYYIGLTDTSVYNTKEELTRAHYFYENSDLNANDFLNSFNFNMRSDYEPNAYDFTVFAMQILMIFIIVFCVFFAGSSIIGEKSLGTLKMTATRPYTRNKLLSGKMLSCIFVGIILLLVSFVASFVVGIAMYGINSMNVLLVVDATKTLVINPIIVLALYLVSCFVNIVFYICLAMVISMILNNTALSVFITSVIYFVSIILNAIVNSPVLKFLPTSHLDLFKYFTKGSLGFLKFNIIPDINLIVSIIVVVATIFVMNLISHLIFTKKDIA